MTGACRILVCLGLAAMCGCAVPWLAMRRDAGGAGDERGGAAAGGWTTVVDRTKQASAEQSGDDGNSESGQSLPSGPSPSSAPAEPSGQSQSSGPQSSAPQSQIDRNALIAELAQMLVNVKRQYNIDGPAKDESETTSDAGSVGYEGDSLQTTGPRAGMPPVADAASVRRQHSSHPDAGSVGHELRNSGWSDAGSVGHGDVGHGGPSRTRSNSLRHDLESPSEAHSRGRYASVFDGPFHSADRTEANAAVDLKEFIDSKVAADSKVAVDSKVSTDSPVTAHPASSHEVEASRDRPESSLAQMINVSHETEAVGTKPASAAAIGIAAEAAGASPAAEKQRDYQAALDEAVRLLETELKDNGLRDHERTRREVALRLLRLASQRPKDWPKASEAIAHLETTSEKEFWTHVLFALATMLDADGMPRADQRGKAALVELREALGRLAELSTLEVHGLAFCTEVQAYGRYVEFPDNRFQPGQEVILYAEVENFMAEPKRNGYETALEGTCEIYDAAGRKAGVHKFDIDREVSRNRRRDFFLPYHYWIPDDLLPGAYSLKLTIKDAKANKMDQATIKFTVDSRR